MGAAEAGAGPKQGGCQALDHLLLLSVAAVSGLAPHVSQPMLQAAAPQFLSVGGGAMLMGF